MPLPANWELGATTVASTPQQTACRSNEPLWQGSQALLSLAADREAARPRRPGSKRCTLARAKRNPTNLQAGAQS